MFSEFFQANLIWFGLLFALIAMLLIDIKKNAFTGSKKVSAAQMPILQREPTYLLDVSSSKDFSAGHIAESINIPSASFSVEDTLFKANKEQNVVVIDQSGMNAGNVAKKLRSAGFTKVYILEGGLTAWRKDNFPLTTKK
ncbi:MAG: rhodanese-like domain-containing protein [Arenicella sp.]